MAYIYLLHFDRPISNRHTTQHYLGYTDNLPKRISLHRRGRAANLPRVAAERGITFRVVRVWLAGKELERSLKQQYKNSPQLCPLCSPVRWRFRGRRAPELSPEQIKALLK